MKPKWIGALAVMAWATVTFIPVTGVSAQGMSAEELESRAIERRAVAAAIWGMPAVNYDLMLPAMKNLHAQICAGWFLAATSFAALAQAPLPPSPSWALAMPPGPDARLKISEPYARLVARDASSAMSRHAADRSSPRCQR